MMGKQDSISTLAKPMSRKEFRARVSELSEEHGFKTTFKVDGLIPDSDAEYHVTSYSISNVGISDGTIDSEARRFRRVLESFDVETFDVDDDAPSSHWFGIRFPNVTTDSFEEFTETVDEIISTNKTEIYLNIIEVTNTKSVRVSGSYNEYAVSKRTIQNEVDSVIERLENNGFSILNGGTAEHGLVRFTVEYPNSE